MIISKTMKYEWFDMEEGTYQDKETFQEKTYWTAYVFPINEDGTVSKKQVTLKVYSEVVGDLKKLKKGEKVELELGMYIKPTEINKLRIYQCRPSVIDYSELIE